MKPSAAREKQVAFLLPNLEDETLVLHFRMFYVEELNHADLSITSEACETYAWAVLAEVWRRGQPFMDGHFDRECLLALAKCLVPVEVNGETRWL